MQLLCFQSPDQLRAVAPLWDDLWRRSTVTLPSAQAEQLALWIEHFAPRRRFRVLVVERSGRFLAGLPLVGRRLGRLLQVGSLPSNVWSSSGELLLDPDSDIEAVLVRLLAGCAELPWPLLWFDLVNVSAAPWQALAVLCRALGIRCDRRDLYRIGQVEVGDDWQTYERSRSRNHRQQIRKRLRQLQRDGHTELVVRHEFRPGEIPSLLRRGFEVENSGWKATAHSSVLQTPGMFDFYCRQAEDLAAAGQLELVFLEHQGRPIAFEYGWTAKGVYFSTKVGFDEDFARYSPGQLLRQQLLHRFHAESRRRVYDFLGPLSPATARWATRTYPIARLVLAPRHGVSRLCLGVLERWRAGGPLPPATSDEIRPLPPAPASEPSYASLQSAPPEQSAPRN